jgi:pimeloyl-ACP methyl ester carboxylesterase
MQAATVDGLRIAYRSAGEGPGIVLCHGGASDGREWGPQLAGLADGFTVVAWDEPGAGQSGDPPDGFDLAGYGDALAGLIRELGLAPAHVGGLSWGGVVALEAYRRNPEVVRSLLLCDTYAGWKGSLPAEEVEARVAGAREGLAAPPEEFKAVLPGLFAAEPQPEIVAELDRIMADTRAASFERLIGLIADADLRDLLPEVAVPTLLVWGEEDVRSPLRVAHEFHQAIPGSELVVIPGAGHMSNLERPGEFNAALLDFCRRAGQAPAR